MADSVIKECRKALKGVHEGSILWTVRRIQQAERVFVVGNGGGAAHACHFAADLRKIAKIQAVSFDSVPEMTARVNDDGWEQAWQGWLRGFGASAFDMVFTFSVGGGLDGLSANLPKTPWGIVGQNGAYGSRIVIPSTSTPVIEGCQAVIAHDIVARLASC